MTYLSILFILVYFLNSGVVCPHFKITVPLDVRSLLMTLLRKPSWLRSRPQFMAFRVNQLGQKSHLHLGYIALWYTLIWPYYDGPLYSLQAFMPAIILLQGEFAAHNPPPLPLKGRVSTLVWACHRSQACAFHSQEKASPPQKRDPSWWPQLCFVRSCQERYCL